MLPFEITVIITLSLLSYRTDATDYNVNCKLLCKGKKAVVKTNLVKQEAKIRNPSMLINT